MLLLLSWLPGSLLCCQFCCVTLRQHSADFLCDFSQLCFNLICSSNIQCILRLIDSFSTTILIFQVNRPIFNLANYLTLVILSASAHLVTISSWNGTIIPFLRAGTVFSLPRSAFWTLQLVVNKAEVIFNSQQLQILKKALQGNSAKTAQCHRSTQGSICRWYCYCYALVFARQLSSTPLCSF